MTIAQSRLTAQGQVSIPAEVRRRLGLAPGSLLQWDDVDGEIVLRRSGNSSFEEIHRRLFPEGTPEPHSLAELKEGIRTYIRKKHARR